MAKKIKINALSEEAKEYGELLDSKLGKMPIEKKKIIAFVLVGAVTALLISVYAFFKDYSQLTLINETEYARIARYIHSRRWSAEDYELRELREFIFQDSTGVVSSYFEDGFIVLFVEGHTYSQRIRFFYHEGKMMAERMPDLFLHYTVSEKKIGEALFFEVSGRTIILYPEK